MNWQFNRISVVGLGYIGLPTAAMFASRKIYVTGIDVSEHAVETINQGKVHIVEPDLDLAVHSAVSQGYLRATTTPEPADAFLIAVPTPFKGDDHEADLSYVEAACRSIAPVLAPGKSRRAGIDLAGRNHRKNVGMVGRSAARPQLPAARRRSIGHSRGPLSRACVAGQSDAGTHS